MIEKKNKVKRTFLEEVNIVSNILKNFNFFKQAFFIIDFNRSNGELLITKTPYGIKKIWRWEDISKKDETTPIVSDRKSFEEKMNKLKEDAEFERFLREKQRVKNTYKNFK